MSSITSPRSRKFQGRPLGVRLWLADVAAGLRIIEKVPARLIGEHRALCVYSFVHRGTPEKPGLVLGLDRGGACRGVAFRVAEKMRAETVAYLRAREQVTIGLSRGDALGVAGGRRAATRQRAGLRGRSRPYAICRAAVDRRTASHRAAGTRPSGNNRDYVLATVKAIEAEGFRDAQLHQLALMLHDAHSHQATSPVV